MYYEKFRLLLYAVSLLAFAYSIHAQQPQKETAAEIKAKHAAYYLCLNTMGKEPEKALESCSTYLKNIRTTTRGWLNLPAALLKDSPPQTKKFQLI